MIVLLIRLRDAATASLSARPMDSLTPRTRSPLAAYSPYYVVRAPPGGLGAGDRNPAAL